MPRVIFNTGLQWNPYDAGTFDPIAILRSPSRTVVTNNTGQYTVEQTVEVPGFGTLPVRVSVRPPTSGGTLTPDPGGGYPTGVVGQIRISVQQGAAFTEIAFVIFIETLNLQASQITSGAVLFNGGFDELAGSSGRDLFNAGPGNDSLNGDNGDDVLLGGGGADNLFGGDGDDVLAGDGVGGGAGDTPAGNDILSGNLGADALYGGGGSDSFRFVVSQTLFGYDANTGRYLGDTIYDFQTGIDQISLGGGDTPLPAGGVITAVYGNNTFVYFDADGDGTAETGEGQVVIFNATVSGGDFQINNANPGAFAVKMFGAASGDLLNGGSSGDTIAGYGGADTIRGGGGGDSLYAGAGDGVGDRFIYGAASDSAYSTTEPTGAAADKIYDFQAGQDKLDFSAIAGAKSALISEFGGSTFVYVNLGNDGTFDLTVLLVGATGVGQGDLILGNAADDEAEAAPVWPDSGVGPSLWSPASEVFAPASAWEVGLP